MSRALAVALLPFVAYPTAAAERNLFEWMAVAPVVLVGDVRADDQRYVELRVDRTLRGGLVEGSVALVDLRRANRDRAQGTPALDLQRGSSYLVLLEPGTRRPRDGGAPVFDLVRGPAGARLLGEGGALIVDAAARMAVWQDRRDEQLLWTDLGRALEDSNPWLVETALDLFAKFRRTHAGLLPALRRLLDAPRPELREKASALAGRAAAHSEPSPAARDAVAALVTLARRDPAVEVRVAATRALGELEDGTTVAVLREIARTDPDQRVRYEAQRILVDRRAPAAGPSIDLPERAP